MQLRADLEILLPDTFLDKVDRATMANGIEARVPFLDTDLVDFALSIPAAIKVRRGEKKRLLKAALRGVVPDWVLEGPKTGFGVPYAYWIRSSLLPFTRIVFAEGAAVRDGLLDRGVVGKLLDEHVSRSRENGFVLWKALNLALWYEDARHGLVRTN